MTAESFDPDDPDTGGRAVPPYDGRRETADVGGKEKSDGDGANVAGATGPVEDDEMKGAEPSETERGAVASPADEQPAEETSDERGQQDEGVGPAHYGGTPRGEEEGA